MFQDFTVQQLNPIFEKIQAFSFPAKQLILQPGSQQIGFYFVIEGSARISVHVEDQEITLALVYPGDFFGEVSAIEGGAPSAFARAEEPTTIYFLSRENFHELTTDNPAISAKMWESLTRIMISRMKRTTGLVQQYFQMNKALCENPKFREFYQLCQLGS